MISIKFSHIASLITSFKWFNMSCPYCGNYGMNPVAQVNGMHVMRCDRCDRQCTGGNLAYRQTFVQQPIYGQQVYGYFPNQSIQISASPMVELKRGNGVSFDISGYGRKAACSGCSYNVSKFGYCPCGAS